MISKIKNWYDKLPEQKKRLDFVTALLTIPVLVTIIVANILNIRTKEQTSKPPEEAEEKPTTIVITTVPPPTSPPQNGITIIPIEVTREPQLTPYSECKKDIGPIEIRKPAEDEVVSQDPVCIEISYNQGDFCSVVWSYRINQGAWSDFTSKSACFSNLPEGETKFELRVKSVVTDKEKLLERNFTVEREDKNITPSPTSLSNPNPTISPTPS